MGVIDWYTLNEVVEESLMVRLLHELAEIMNRICGNVQFLYWSIQKYKSYRKSISNKKNSKNNIHLHVCDRDEKAFSYISLCILFLLY